MTSNIRLSYNNMAAAGTLSASSALTDFPASYAVDTYRSRKWKPKGSFRIDATNNKIYINDGSPATATLTSAVYETGTALATEVQTQLNAVSSSWTCTYSTSTGIFTIDRSAGTKTLVLTTTTAAAWDTLGYTGASDQDAAAADVRRNHTSERMAIDLGSTLTPTCFFAYQSPDSQFCISSSATCVIKGNSIDDYDTAAITIALSVTDDGIFKFFDDLSTSYRYWWFDFEDRENSDGPQSFALKLWLGDYVSPTTYNVVNGFQVRLVDPSIVRVASSGERYFNRKTKYTKISNVSVQWLRSTDRDIFRDAFAYCGVTRPIFVSLDPSAAISSGIEELTKLCNFDGDPEMYHQKFDQYAFNMSFSEIVG